MEINFLAHPIALMRYKILSGMILFMGWHLPSWANSSFPILKTPKNLSTFIRNPKAAVQLGKAFFWDMQAGSDGKVACATCHHSAFSDSRFTHQLDPGPNRHFQSGTLNQRLNQEHFPISTDDVLGSQGVIKARFKDIILGKAEEDFELIPDPIFNLKGKNIRQVTSLNSPSVILSAFNHRNFWNGRANTIFNGVTPFGKEDPEAKGKIWKVNRDLDDLFDFFHLPPPVIPVTIHLDASSAASQAVGPALDGIEMSYHGRTWPKLAKKLFHLKPLAKQKVHPQDSVLGPLSTFPDPGLNTYYADLIQEAFQRNWWDSQKKFSLDPKGNPIPMDSYWNDEEEDSTDLFRLMEVNFSLFWGLAIQMYESTLISDLTPFDQFRKGVRLTAFNERVQKGMELFHGKAQCFSCHRETLLAAATHENIDKLGMSIARFQADQQPAFLDTGFFNIAVRPTQENLGIGGNTPFNTPLSISKVLHSQERLAIDGAFKAPALRNVALTGPYFHNGGKMDLDQVLDFYQTKGDFFDLNFKDININLVNVNFDDEEQKDLKAFLTIGLTDPRVITESAPFDHPDLIIPHGYSQSGNELFEIIPAIGARGRTVENLPPLEAFLQ